MLRLFQVYYPVRRLLLVFSEASIVCVVFWGATVFAAPDAAAASNRASLASMALLCAVVVLFSHYLDLYSPECVAVNGGIYVRLLLMVAISAFTTSVLRRLLPSVVTTPISAPGILLLLAPPLVLWRAFYVRLLQQGYLRKRVFVVGSGPRAMRVTRTIRSRPDLGLELVGWDDSLNADTTNRDHWIKAVRGFCGEHRVNEIIVALDDPRGRMPTRELLDVWMSGISVQDASMLLERADGKIEVDGLTPSALMFSEGFRLNRFSAFTRRALTVFASLVIAILAAPIVPLVALAVRLSSPGPVLLRQRRVGYRHKVFTLYKFRTMRLDAEAEGPKWAVPGDPRVTRLGRVLRITRLDEIPQLWNILRGDMNLVGPRPERPEFVEWLANNVPYYDLRHIVRPGLTGWAQVRYRYTSSSAETKEKLQYDLYYIKHMSLSLDVMIMFETLKTILRQRGAL